MLQLFEEKRNAECLIPKLIQHRRDKAFDYVKEAIDVEAICNIIVSFNSLNLLLPSFAMNDI